MRLIDADELTKMFCGLAGTCMASNVLEAIENAPTVEPKKGKWITNNGISTCSECGNICVWPYDFCSNCGADMRGDNNGKID